MSTSRVAVYGFLLGFTAGLLPLLYHNWAERAEQPQMQPLIYGTDMGRLGWLLNSELSNPGSARADLDRIAELPELRAAVKERFGDDEYGTGTHGRLCIWLQLEKEVNPPDLQLLKVAEVVRILRN